MRRACLPSRLTAFLCAAGMTLSMATAVLGATFNAASGLDVPDANPGDGICLAAVGQFGICTLRAAVDEANAWPGHDTILISAGIKVLGSALSIQDDVTLEGAGTRDTVITGDQDQMLFLIRVEARLEAIISDLTIRGATRSGMSVAGDIDISRVWFDGNAFSGLSVNGSVEPLTATVRDSTFSHNGFAMLTTDRGGGLSIAGKAHVVVTNSTFYGNMAGSGGAIAVFGFEPSLDLRSSTLVDNIDTELTVNDSSAIYRSVHSPPVHIDKTLIRGTCFMDGFTSVTSNGGNAEGPGDTCLLGLASDGANLTSEQLQLGPLGDYGGPAPTVLPGSGSVAVDPGLSPAGCPSADARGEPRSDFSCDIGAVERQLGDPEPGSLFEDGFESGDTSRWQ